MPKMMKKLKVEREELVVKTHSFIQKYIEIDIKFGIQDNITEQLSYQYDPSSYRAFI